MKKMLCWILVFVIVMSLCACGKKTESISAWQEQYDLGVRYLSEGNYEQAILAFTAAIEIDPNMTDAYIGRADAYIGFGENEANLAAALADYEKILELDHSNAAAWLGLADVYIRWGEFDKALDVLKEGLEKSGIDAKIADKIHEIELGSITDSSGNFRKMVSFTADGKVEFWHEYTYDNQNRMATVTSYDPNGTQTGRVVLAYAANDYPLVSFYWSETGAVGKVEYELNEEGKPVKELHYTLEGDCDIYFLMKYDEEGNLVRQEQYDMNGMLGMYVEHKYFDGGVTTRHTYNADGTLFDSAEFTPDEDRYYTAEGELEMRIVRRYNDDGDYVGEESYDGEGNLISSWIYGE